MAALSELAIAVSGHPARSRQMARMHLRGVGGLRVKAEDYLDRFLPVGALIIGVEKLEIGNEMALVILGHLIR